MRITVSQKYNLLQTMKKFEGNQIIRANDVTNISRVGTWARAVNDFAVSLEIDFAMVDVDTSVEEALAQALQNRMFRENDLKRRKEIDHLKAFNPPAPLNPSMVADDRRLKTEEKIEKELKEIKKDIKDLKAEKTKIFAACGQIVKTVQETVDDTLNTEVLDALNHPAFKNNRLKQTQEVIKSVVESMSVDVQAVLAKLKTAVHRVEHETPTTADDLLVVVQSLSSYKAEMDGYASLYGNTANGVSEYDLIFALKQAASHIDNNEIGGAAEKIIAKANEQSKWSKFKKELSKELKSKSLMRSGKKNGNKESDKEQLKAFKGEIKELKSQLESIKEGQNKSHAFFGQGDGVCNDWKKGICKRGSWCKFKHTPGLEGTYSRDRTPPVTRPGTPATVEHKKRERERSSPSNSRNSSPGSSRNSSPSIEQKIKQVRA